MNTISPKYRIHLIEEIENELWKEFKSYPKVLGYLKEWHTTEYYNNFDYSENFQIAFKDESRSQVNVMETLLNMPGELTLKVAIDLGLETPDFIPSIPEFRNEIKDHYHNASEVFEKAFHAVENDPALAIGLACSALESILKDVCISLMIDNYNEHSTLSGLIKMVMKHFRETNTDFPNEIVIISNNLTNVAKSIEDIRSDKTSFHGKSSGSEMITDPIYAYFIINATATLGLFVVNYQNRQSTLEDSIDYSDLPF